jgi:hypothetical protein
MLTRLAQRPANIGNQMPVGGESSAADDVRMMAIP